jgi:hypothetical protein
VQGAGSGASTIRLAPNSAGFNDKANPKPILKTKSGNDSFRQNIWDIAFSVGAGNAGAIAIDYVSSNQGALRNLSIVSEDGQGIAGVWMRREWPGPLLVKDVSIKGFDVGIDIGHSTLGPVLEGITVEGQKIAGIRNKEQTVPIRNFKSTNSVPALINENDGFAIIIDGNFTGGSSANSANVNSSTLYLRNITTSGYASSLRDTYNGANKTITGTIAEYLAGTPQALGRSLRSESLKLPIKETPSFHDNDMSQWEPVQSRWYGDTSGLQTALNSGKSTVYFPFDTYFAYDEARVTVPASVKRIVGFASGINGGGGVNGGGYRIVVEGDSSEPLIIEQLAYGVKIEHRGKRLLVIKHGMYAYTSVAGAGDLYLEDVVINELTVQASQNVWARQFNNEGNGPSTKITNLGGTLWSLGLKTEEGGTIVDARAGSKTEILGGLHYPSRSVAASDVAYLITDAQLSTLYTQPNFLSNGGYATQVRETINGTTRNITSSQGNTYRMPLFVGF